MGINLRDHVKNIDDLFTMEEAERLFIAAGYVKNDQQFDGYEKIKITNEILENNQKADSPQSMGNNGEFEIKVKPTRNLAPSLRDFDVVGIGKVTIPTNIGGAA